MNISTDCSVPSPANELVRALLERHGLPKHRHASFVGEFFNLSRAAAHQRVNKSSAWTLDDFQKLGNHFGETLTQVVGAVPSPGLPARLNLDGVPVDCRIWLDDSKDAGTETEALDAESLPALVRGPLVAMDEGGVYVVVPAAAASGLKVRGITRLEISPDKTSVRRVAVFDDAPDVAKTVCEMLGAAGIDSKAFSSAASFLAVIARDEFDGYVTDWLLPGGDTAVHFLAAVRALPEHRALVLLSGALRNGMADPREVAAATLRFAVQLVEKPVLPPQLVSALLVDGLNASRREGSRSV